MYLVISTSLNPESRSRLLARAAREQLARHTEQVEYLDLQDFPLPFCDGGACYANENVQRLGGLVRDARGVLLVTPIYNYDANAAAKNVVELTGKAWTDKVVGFLCAAGGKVSYMALMGLANSLMLDFRALVLPRFVYTTGADYDGQSIKNEDIQERVAELAHRVVQVGEAVSDLPTPEAF